MALVMGSTGEWEVVIGLEIHAQIVSKAKLFSASATNFGAEPNSQVSYVDAAFPGMLPVVNMECIKQAVKSGLGLNGKVNKFSQFDRKNYFYADLPSGYQISQMYHPIIDGGFVDIHGDDGAHKKVRIHHIHVEQDAGKSMHDQSPTSSFIDLNRSGVALMEIVTEPDIRSAEEAAAVMKKLRSVLRYLGTCDGDMEKGSMRCDANVSVRKVGAELGTRCEIKNLNSIKNIMKAIEYETMRQIDVLESGGSIDQETRLFNVALGETKTMRSKEDAHDYRYFPDPDLLPVNLTDEFIAEVQASLPELPDQKIARYQQEMGISEYDAEVLSADKEVAKFYEEVAAKTDAKLAANWIIGDLFALLNKEDQNLQSCKISAADLAALINLIKTDVISGKIAKQVFEDMFASGEHPEAIVEKKGLVQISDDTSINKMIDEVIASNQDKYAEYKAGKEKLFGFFVGQVMKKSAGKANPQKLNELLQLKLKS